MAKKRKTKQRGRDLVREGLLLGAVALQVLLLVALITDVPMATAHEDLVGVVVVPEDDHHRR